MELALTDLEAGYYTAAERRLGEAGDFTTAPRRVPAFNRALARLLAGLVDSLAESGGRAVTLVEVGPGEGDLAAGVLALWEEERPDLRDIVRYRLVEVGAGLRRRQEESLREAAVLGWDVAWLASMEEAPGEVGLVVTNELLDALPVHRVDVGGGVAREAWVRLQQGEAGHYAQEEWGELSPPAREELQLLSGTVEAALLAPLTKDGHLELRPAVGAFLAQAATAFATLCVVSVDYGDWLTGPATGAGCPTGLADAVTPVLHGHSLRAYYRHQRRTDPYDAVGRQDLTADVDFRAMAVHGARLGLECLLLTTVAALLSAFGGAAELESLEEEDYSLARDMAASSLEALLRPGGAGGLFKVMVQVREPPPG